MMEEIKGNIVDITVRRIYPGCIRFENGRIVSVQPIDGTFKTFLLPGFIDAHVHVESSMLTPGHFAAAAVVHGTIASVSDPHEIANVLGIEGIEFMLRDGATVPFKFCFGAPSCVPATPHETAGASLDVDATRLLLADARIGYLSEMMNWPGVLGGDTFVLAKIAAAIAVGKPVDGHAPGLRGADAARYHAAGISTDHECFTLAEALDKLAVGASILIREGSAARNLEALWPLIGSHVGRVMLCSDDKHPNDLVRGHVNELCARLVAKGADLYDILMAACVVPARHYRLPVGLLRAGDPADFIEVRDLETFAVPRTWIDGTLVAEGGRALFSPVAATALNRFQCESLLPHQLQVVAQSESMRVIVVDDGQIVTRQQRLAPTISQVHGNPLATADPSRDLLKIVVLNRYSLAPPAVAFVQGFGLQRGAIAGSVAHDSHNIIAVGVSDAEICLAINGVIAEQGGLSVADGSQLEVLPLPIAGLMSLHDCATVAKRYEELEAAAISIGSSLRSPFMTLSFMALLVIPSLKLSDRGLFDGEKFEFVPLFES